MIGHTEILNARMRGYSPEQVHVHVLDNPPSYWLKQDATDALENGFRAQILILPNESISSLDLSVLEGLIVHVEGPDQRRCGAVIKQVCKHAERVLHFADGALMDWRADHVTA